MRPHLPPDGMKTTKLLSWNVNGLRALLKIKGLASLALEDFDVLCLQETKLQVADVYMASFKTKTKHLNTSIIIMAEGEVEFNFPMVLRSYL